MSATHFISDTHFGHAGIIKLCGRPFVDGAGEPDVRSMHQTMIACWNAVVRPNDDVIHLGDFAYRADSHVMYDIFGKLNGRKHLIAGNHDNSDTKALPWASIRELACVTVESQRIVICHYPMLDWPDRYKGALQLYGHTHGRIRGHQQSADIGVDVMGWAPVRLSAIKQYMATLGPAPDPEADDLEQEVPTP
jgi:calcineurin-like phosphoesterase family protein